MNNESLPSVSYEQPSSDALLSLTQDGDTEAFGLLFEANRARLLGAAARVVGFEEAEDVVQQVALQTFPKVDQFEDRGAGITPWLYRATRNAALDAVRRGGRMVMNPTDPIEDAHVFDQAAPAADMPEEAAMENDSLARVEAALGKLSPDHAGLLRALYVDGETLSEYGERENLPQGTRGSRHSRAKAALRELVESGEVDLG